VISTIVHSARPGEDTRDGGQALVEYALILMLVAIVAFAALEAIGTSVAGALSDAAAGF
jgi:Flp pilus assembly pilin Flp